MAVRVHVMDVRAGGVPELEDPAAPLAALLRTPVLFYPGAGLDWEPLRRFHRHAGIRTFVYVDHGVARQEIGGGLAAMPGYRLGLCADLAPADLGVEGWRDLGREGGPVSGPVGPGAAFALRAVLWPDDGAAPATLFYLGTEVGRTYAVLWGGVRKAPMVMVVQDGGEGALRQRVEAKPPSFLYAGETACRWEGYRQVSPFAGGEGHHPPRRAIFVRG